MSLHILDIIELGSQWILDVDDKNFPIGFTLIKESHDAEDLDLLNLANIAHLFTDLTYIQGVVIAPSLGLSMGLGWIFPSLFPEPVSVNDFGYPPKIA